MICDKCIKKAVCRLCSQVMWSGENFVGCVEFRSDDALNKIRAEIEQEYNKYRNMSEKWDERACGIGTALEIIDKYFPESVSK